MDHTASRFSCLVQTLLALLAQHLGTRTSFLTKKLCDDGEYIEKLSARNDRVQTKSPWPSEPGQFKRWIERHLKSLHAAPSGETPLQYANEVKGLFTTLGSLMIACHGFWSLISEEEILSKIHDFWVECTLECLKNFPEELEKRSSQLVPFDQLSDEEKAKDKIWLFLSDEIRFLVN